jgi:3',5'-cyclic AMP phosphodiesterase CpdA
MVIHAGDLTINGTLAELKEQIAWLNSLPGFAAKTVIAGNHDRCLAEEKG